jgi:hypothetical protein
MDSAALQTGFDLINSRLDGVTRSTEGLLGRVIQLIECVAHLDVRQQSVFALVQKTDSTVASQGARLVVLEDFRTAHPLSCPWKDQVRLLEATIEKGAVKRGLWYAQGKAVWHVVSVLLGALAGAGAARLLR